jgi:hypothetical protein
LDQDLFIVDQVTSTIFFGTTDSAVSSTDPWMINPYKCILLLDFISFILFKHNLWWRVIYFQHAADEKYNFECLSQSTILNQQPLLRWGVYIIVLLWSLYTSIPFSPSELEGTVNNNLVAL